MILKGVLMQNNTDCCSRTNRLDYSGLDQVFPWLWLMFPGRHFIKPTTMRQLFLLELYFRSSACHSAAKEVPACEQKRL